jgi:hypothetical protein
MQQQGQNLPSWNIYRSHLLQYFSQANNVSGLLLSSSKVSHILRQTMEASSKVAINISNGYVFAEGGILTQHSDPMLIVEGQRTTV